ncbi:MAG: hypothetical protein BWY77_00579 [bacterium ADurb.Bin431]|nr:MAG: hypothetical protein BWY77_00579 [bacterium ADurb.Bin431]
MEEGDQNAFVLHYLDLMLAQLFVEFGFLDLENDVGLGIESLHISDDLGTGVFIFLVAEKDPITGR